MRKTYIAGAPAPEPERYAEPPPPAPVRGPSKTELETLRSMSNLGATRPGRQWAYDLLASEAAGDKRPVTCVAMAKRAVKADRGGDAPQGWDA